MTISVSELRRLCFMTFFLFAALLFSETYDTAFYLLNGTVIFFFIYIVSILLLLKNKSFLSSLKLLFQEKYVLFLLVLTFVSVIWSVSPDDTLTGAITLTGTLFLALYIVQTNNLTNFIKILTIYFFFFCLVNTLYVLFSGAGLDVEHNGAWKGLLGQKNRFGMFLSIAFLVSLISFRKSKGHFKLFSLITLVFSLVLIIKADSKTALVLSILILITILFSKVIRMPPYLLISLLSLMLSSMILGIYLVFIFNKKITELTGFEFTFTGRTEIWSAILRFISQSPLSGYGYNGFWNSSLVTDFNRMLLYNETTSSHNGYFDVVLSLGIFALAAVLVILIKNVYKVITLYRLNKDNNFLFLALLLMYFIIYNFTESLLLLRNNFITVLFFCLIFYIYKSYREIKVHKS